METLLYALSMLCATIGLVGAVVRGFYPLAMSIIALGLLFFCSTPPLTVAELFIMVAIATVATISAKWLSPRITKRWGGSKAGYCGAVVGMLAGFMLYPPFGVLLSPFFGAVMGEMVNDRSDVGRVFSQGFATFCAFLVGAWVQFVVALWVMWLLVNSILPTLIAQCEGFISKF